MDPVTALAAASAIWTGIKGAVAAGQEIQDVFGQMGAWFEKAGEVYEYINYREGKPSVYDIHKPQIKSETSEAFELYTAKVKLREMEAEIRHEFLYGGLCHLGMDGYREFLAIRQDIKVRRAKYALEQQKQKQQRLHEIRLYGGIILGTATAVVAVLALLILIV